MNAPLATSATSSEAREAAQHCLRVTRQRARNFYYGLKLLPEPQRSAMYAIYAWMRAADDIVDDMQGDHAQATLAQLETFRAHTDESLSGRPPHNESLWIALASVASRFRIQAEHFHGMLDGQLDDLARGRHDTFDELRNYCYRVASTVGLICIEIWGYTHDSAREKAIDRGIAFQLTNIIRDYKQDYDAGRIYLPLEDFERHGIDPNTLREWSSPIACHTMMMQQIQRASMFYDRSAGLEDLVTSSCRPTLWAMTTIYRELLGKMSRHPANIVLRKRMRLSAIKKAAIAMRARWRTKSARQTNVRAHPVTEA